jgi:uncharacterized protein
MEQVTKEYHEEPFVNLGLPDTGHVMQDASWQNQMVMQWLSYSPTAWEIDGEVGSLAKDLVAGKKESGEGYLTYLRYNMWLNNTSLQPLMGKAYTQEQIDGLTEMSNAGSRFELFDIGAKAAQKEVSASHFPASFKIK